MRGRTGLAILYLPTDGGEGDPESPLRSVLDARRIAAYSLG